MAATLIRPSRLTAVDHELLTVLESAAPGTILSRASDRLGHAHDASHYLLTPQVVAAPTSVGEVAALFSAATAEGKTITLRSGGTSLSGQSSSEGILIDTRRNFHSIEVLDSGHRVRVQPGATVRQVNARLAQYKRKLGPDPRQRSRLHDRRSRREHFEWNDVRHRVAAIGECCTPNSQPQQRVSKRPL